MANNCELMEEIQIELVFLKKAIELNDPKEQLILRTTDILEKIQQCRKVVSNG